MHVSGVAAAAILVALNLALYRDVLALWWTHDDPFNLRLVIQHGALESFFRREMWPQQLFTPLMLVAFEAALALFGLNAALWYAAQLALLCATSAAVYAAARMFLDGTASLVAAATFAAGAPVCSVVMQLSTVHYLIAIVCAALSLIAFTLALRRASTRFAMLSAAFYLAAVLAKEIAITLPLLLVFLPVGTARNRLRFARIHGVAVVVYFVTRYAVLGTFLGAYGWVVERGEWPRLLARFPLEVAKAAAGATPILAGAMLVLMALPLLYAMRKRRTALFVAVAAVVVLAPILPVAKEMNRRYVVVPWLGWTIAAVAAAAAIPDRRVRLAFLAAFPLLTIAVNRREWAHEYAVRARMSEEARAFVALPPTSLLRRPATPSGAMHELAWLRSAHLGRPAGASWFYDDFFLCANDVSARRIFEFDDARRQVVDVTGAIAGIRARHCSSIHNLPLSVAFRYRRPALHWEFGPHVTGEYKALIADGFEAFPLRRRDALNVPGIETLPIRIRYDSPEGQTTYSPQFVLDLRKPLNYAWRRKSTSR